MPAAQGLKTSPAPLGWTNEYDGGDTARHWPGWQALHAVGGSALGLNILSKRPTHQVGCPDTFVIACYGSGTHSMERGSAAPHAHTTIWSRAYLVYQKPIGRKQLLNVQAGTGMVSYLHASHPGNSGAPDKRISHYGLLHSMEKGGNGHSTVTSAPAVLLPR